MESNSLWPTMLLHCSSSKLEITGISIDVKGFVMVGITKEGFFSKESIHIVKCLFTCVVPWQGSFSTKDGGQWQQDV
jgi:hypothetical protein